MDARRSPSAALAAWRAELAASRRSPWLASLVLRHATAVACRAAAIHARLAALPRRTRRRLARQWAMALPVAALALAWSGGAAEAATITVGGGCTLVDAIHAANGDEAVGGCDAGSGADTVVLGGGVFSYANTDAGDEGQTALPTVRSEVVIAGGGAVLQRSAGASSAFRLLTVDASGTLLLQSVTIRGGGKKADAPYSSVSGAGILSRGSLELRSSRIAENAGSLGGGVAAYGGRLTMRDVTVSGNAAAQGGGIFAVSWDEVPVSVTIVDSRLEENQALGGRGGGAIYVMHNGYLTLRSSLVRGNLSGELGGGLTVSGQVLIQDSTITGNSAVDVGGIVTDHDTPMEISNSVFSGNVADYHAGAILSYGPTTIHASRIEGNRAMRGGGLMNGSQVTISDSAIRSNEAERGGGWLVWGDASATRVEISGNSAVRGGGVHLEGEGLRLAESQVTGNVAELGGGVFVYGSSLELHRSRVSGNRANHGGGLYVDAFGPANRLVDSELSDNEADTRGGGLLAKFGEVTLFNVTLAGNRAGEVGGGIYSLDSRVSLHRSSIVANEAPSGAALATLAEIVDLRDSLITASLGGPDCHGEAGLFEGAGNLIDDHEDGACAELAAAAVMGLATSLADNGGPTHTYALLPGSNAIDALPDCASADEAAGVLTDQRGTARPQDGDGDGVAACDVGAYELAVLGAPIYLPAALR